MLTDLIKKVLHTKNGRLRGNAICVTKTGSFYQVVSDYGNEAMLTRTEIETFYEIGDRAEKTHKHYYGIQKNRYFPEELDREADYPKAVIIKPKKVLTELRPAYEEMQAEHIEQTGEKWKQPSKKQVNSIADDVMAGHIK